MDLAEIQKVVLGVIQQPLTPSEGMRKRTLDGRPVKKIVDQVIKPNDRLSAFERLEIYNRVYWFRLLSSFMEDFPGLRAILGDRAFEKLATAYLYELPSESFTLRNLGSRLEAWLRKNPKYTPKSPRLALDMVRLEWADIDVFDQGELPKLTAEDLSRLGEDPVFHFQPYIRLLDLAYPVDDLLLEIRRLEEAQEADIASNVVVERTHEFRGKRWPVPKREKIFLAVHRQEGEDIFFKRLEPEAFALLRALQQGKTLSQAIEESVNWTQGKVEDITGQLREWFANWSSLGWFCKPEAE
ncbi:MAG TPA: putative DNA-binding domain-containing protein [Candidatus Angelobacter sp.]|jgi:hypothetical protein|nr:putative DNA-binding domain-containing protein [Candidatus Angelobacter sp.]